MTDEKIYKIGGRIELPKSELEHFYTSGSRWLVSYRSVWQLNYSPNAGYYGTLVYYLDKNRSYAPITKRGRFFATSDGDYLNKLTETKLFKNF